MQLKNCTQDAEILMEKYSWDIKHTLLQVWCDSIEPKYRRDKNIRPAAKEQKLRNRQLKNCTQDAGILI